MPTPLSFRGESRDPVLATRFSLPHLAEGRLGRIEESVWDERRISPLTEPAPDLIREPAPDPIRGSLETTVGPVDTLMVFVPGLSATEAERLRWICTYPTGRNKDA